jgi:hypothetical protein
MIKLVECLQISDDNDSKVKHKNALDMFPYSLHFGISG